MKRIIGIIALCAVLLSMSACKKEEEKANTTEETGVKSEVKLLDGEKFSMYIALPTCKSSYVAPEETGDSIVDAIHLRNALVEEELGVKLDFTVSDRTTSGTDQQAETDKIRTLIQSGDTTYDAFVHVQHSGMPTLITEKMFVDWNTIPNINLEEPWWYSNIERDICYGDKIYLMTGDYNYTTFSNLECLVFNKEMCDELELDYPYESVQNGTWTHDKFLAYIKAAGKDINGDGKIAASDDRMGFGGWYYEQVPALFSAYGGTSLVRDDDNLPVLAIDTERNYTVIDKMIEIFDNQNTFAELKTYSAFEKAFKEGRLLFMDGFLLHAAGLRSAEIDFGIIPFPKLDETQEDYYSRAANVGGFTYIPVTNQNLEKTGLVLESMARHSYDTITPTYFDKVLTIKTARDIESEEMITLIKDSARFTDAGIWSPASIGAAGKGNTLSSEYASRKDALEVEIEALVDLYK
ncbi:MAG: extracellular solute-binding protein [Clostridia bacterium]|nr:extracellular solute-binding protein [Clostridia bacterium]